MKKCTELYKEILEELEEVAGKNEQDTYVGPGEYIHWVATPEWKNKIKSLYKLSHEMDFYWEFCTLKTFKETIAYRLEVYLNSNFDAEEEDFYKRERDNLFFSQFQLQGMDISEYLDEDLKEKFELSKNKKMEFLDSLISNLSDGKNESGVNLTQPEIALIAFYNEWDRKKDLTEIAKANGFTSDNSNKSIQKHFKKFSKTKDILSYKKTTEMIKRLSKIIGYDRVDGLSVKGAKDAQNDLNTLKARQGNGTF